MFKMIIIFDVNEQGGPLTFSTGWLKKKMFEYIFLVTVFIQQSNNG